MASPSGPGAVLGMVRRGEVGTRAQVAAATGLSRVPAAARVDALLQAGLVVEAGGAPSTGGRRPGLLRFAADRGVVLAASLDTAHARLAALDLAGRVLHEELLEVAVADGPDPVLKAVEEGLRRCAATVDVPVLGVGVSLPAPVDPATGRPSSPPIMPGWDGVPVCEHVQEVFGVPTVVENDANAMAVGEQALAHPECRTLCLVKVSTGIGAGVVVGGELYRGVDGGAGDIGHVRLPGEDALCACGSRGCLASVASGAVVARALAHRGRDAAHGLDVTRLLAAGDPLAHDLVRQAGRRIGEVLATVVCLLNPGVLVVSGDLASASLVSGVREGLYPRSLPRATRHLMVVPGRLGERAALVGLCRTVVDTVLAPDAVDARLGWSR